MAVKIGTPIHCVELTTGKNLTGALFVSDETMWVELHSYADFFSITSDAPLVLKTSDGDIVSLHSNLTPGTGSTSRMVDPESETRETIWHQKVTTNVVVVGNNRWEETDKVKRVRFTVNHVDHLLRHRAKIDAISSNRYPGEGHFSLFNDAAEDMTLSAWYGASYNSALSSPKGVWPVFGIEFDEPAGLYEYTKYVSNYVFFLSLMVGVRLAPRDIHIDRLSRAAMMQRVEAHTYPGEHRVHYTWPEDKLQEHDTNGFGSPVRAYDDEALAAFRATLIAWMDRAGEWRKAYELMMGSFAFRHIVSTDRLINACRWLEEIPGTKAQDGIPADHVAAIAAAAVEKATALGHPAAMLGRIQNAIGWIRAETSEERFSRLLATVRARFGNDILPVNALGHLTRTVRFRGRVAHGHFEAEDDAEDQAFYKSTCAMEALCLLLTVHDLPISQQGRDQISSHPMIEGYRHAYE